MRGLTNPGGLGGFGDVFAAEGVPEPFSAEEGGSSGLALLFLLVPNRDAQIQEIGDKRVAPKLHTLLPNECVVFEKNEAMLRKASEMLELGEEEAELELLKKEATFV
jgi:hypothetical protein